MGTHPIFESDFDCLTESKMEEKANKAALSELNIINWKSVFWKSHSSKSSIINLSQKSYINNKVRFIVESDPKLVEKLSPIFGKTLNNSQKFINKYKKKGKKGYYSNVLGNLYKMDKRKSINNSVIENEGIALLSVHGFL